LVKLFLDVQCTPLKTHEPLADGTCINNLKNKIIGLQIIKCHERRGALKMVELWAVAFSTVVEHIAYYEL